MRINPLVAELQNCKWAMEESALRVLFERLSELKQDSALQYIAVDKKPAPLQVIDGVAVINISGVLLKEVPYWFRWWGIEATSYGDIKAQIDQAIKFEKVTSIELHISSPGGVLDGLADTADAVLDARGKKPVTAVIEDLGASAAYWLASQANTISANRTAEVGSIGVYTAYIDSSKRAEDMGYKVIVIKSGEHKAMGVVGAEITDEQIEAVQDVVDKLADNFVSAVAAGRGVDKKKIETLATGRLWISADAKKIGLIDTVNQMKIENVTSSIKETKGMEKEQTKTEAAGREDFDISAEVKKAAEELLAADRKRLSALRAEFPDDPGFALAQYEKGSDVTQAKAEYCDVLKEKLADAGKTETAAGAAPLSGSEEGNEKTIDFNAAAKALAKEEGIKLGDAYKRIARERPDVYYNYVDNIPQVNINTERRRMRTG